MKTPDINPEEYYSASTIIRNKWLPWIKHVNTFKSILDTPEGVTMYKPIIRTAGQYTYRKIKGECLLEVIKLADRGKLN